MSDITHVYIPVEILRLGLSGQAELLILSLAASFGTTGITMSNNGLAGALHISRRNVIRAIGRLKSLGLLSECGSRNRHRLIARADLHGPTGDKVTPAVVSGCHSNGDVVSPITKVTEDNITLSAERASFIAPTLEEVKQYIAEKNLNVDAAAFHAYFAEGGWVDSNGRKVRNWKQKVQSWHSHGKGRSNGKRDGGIVRTFGHLTSKYGKTIDNSPE